jgi:hypothetical protein
MKFCTGFNADGKQVVLYLFSLHDGLKGHGHEKEFKYFLDNAGAK